MGILPCVLPGILLNALLDVQPDVPPGVLPGVLSCALPSVKPSVLLRELSYLCTTQVYFLLMEAPFTVLPDVLIDLLHKYVYFFIVNSLA
jgi:hypothetical protein